MTSDNPPFRALSIDATTAAVSGNVDPYSADLAATVADPLRRCLVATSSKCCQPRRYPARNGKHSGHHQLTSTRQNDGSGTEFGALT